MGQVPAVALGVVIGVVAAACGGGAGGTTVPPPRVDPALAPATVSHNLALHPNTAPATVDAFANAGEQSLVADGRLWEIRRADRLVGTLQITTVVDKVDLRRAENRDKIVRQILSGSVVRLRIEGVEVFHATSGGGKAVYIWFGDGIFEVVQLRDRQLEEIDGYTDVVTDIIRHQATVPAWKPLPAEEA